MIEKAKLNKLFRKILIASLSHRAFVSLNRIEKKPNKLLKKNNNIPFVVKRCTQYLNSEAAVSKAFVAVVFTERICVGAIDD